MDDADQPQDDISEEPGFAPYDTTDGRAPGDWKTRYVDPSAQKAILIESLYLAALLALAPILMFIIWIGWPNAFLHIADPRYATFMRYSFAWISGTLGGTLFDIKWLYHAVAKCEWHLDRRQWRLFTPHLSGGLSFAIVTLVSSGFVRIFDAGAIESNSMVVGIAFLIGYFSDSAVAKLSQLAETLFGESRPKKKADPKTEAARAKTAHTTKNSPDK